MKDSTVTTRRRASGRCQPAGEGTVRSPGLGFHVVANRGLTPPARQATPLARRAAATLAEVLVSLMLMGIGVVTVATLIPASILRTLQATQLTNATILRYDTEALIDLRPNLVHNPDGMGVDDPAVLPNAPVPNAAAIEHYTRNYIVDPLGWVIVANDGGAADSFGPLRRFHGGLLRYIESNGIPGLQVGEQTVPPDTRTEDDAELLVTLPDSWVFQVEDVPTAANLTTWPPPPWPSVTMPASLDLTSVPTLAGDSRVVLFDITGRFSHVRGVTSINTGTNVVEFDRPVVAGFQLGQVRIESRERRYTWLLTVRNRGAGRAAVDVVVFFRRPFSPEDEQVYTANFIRVGADGQPGAAGVDDDVDGNIDVMPAGQPDSKEIGWIGTDDREIVVDWTATPTQKPFYRKGSFVFDVRNAYWYRVQDVTNETGTTATLVLDRPITADSTAGAIFMRGVVEVFSIGTKSL